MKIPTTSPRSTPMRRVGAAMAAGVAALLVVPAVAEARTTSTVPAGANPTTPACVAAPDLRQRAGTEIARRQITLDQLLTSLGSAADTYGVNAAQQTALQTATSGLADLGRRIASNCYATRETLRADVATIFTNYRVYALRLPQTHVIVAAGHLGGARDDLQRVADRLAGAVGSNQQATADLAAMNAALAAADARIGRPPTLVGTVADVPGLQPAVDVTPLTAALKAARTDLEGARTDLATARAKALSAVAALGG